MLYCIVLKKKEMKVAQRKNVFLISLVSSAVQRLQAGTRQSENLSPDDQNLSSPLPLTQLHRERAGRVDPAARLHPAAAGEQGALGGAAAPAAPAGAAAPRAGGVQAPTAGRAAEAYRAAERAEEAAGGGERFETLSCLLEKRDQRRSTCAKCVC